MTDSRTDAIVEFLKAQAAREAHLPKPEGSKPVVAVARGAGSGGEAIGRRIADQLGIAYYDRDIVEQVAERAHAELASMEALDERSAGPLAAHLMAILPSSRLQPSRYLMHLVPIVLAMAAGGGVIMGRGAHLILHRYPVFRLRIVGSPSICARRLQDEEGGEVEEIHERIRSVDAERARFLWETFHARLNDPLQFDLVVNTDHWKDLDLVARLIVDAMGALAPQPLSA
jgi:cytidylate kinase